MHANFSIFLKRFVFSARILGGVLTFGLTSSVAFAGPSAGSQDILVKFKSKSSLIQYMAFAGQSTDQNSVKFEDLHTGNWAHVLIPKASFLTLENLKNDPNVLYIQPNYKLRLIEDFSNSGTYQSPNFIAELMKQSMQAGPIAEDKPELPSVMTGGGSGADPLAINQWGMKDIGVKNAWKKARGAGVIVAVIDSGVDYTHEDLIQNMWRNQGELGFDEHGRNKANNNVDDDGNGYVDDVVGWDFSDNDHKPYDVHGTILDVVLKGENPGHGTHCAGNVAAREGNGKGIAGVAPDAQIMALRFISKAGQGTTADAIKAIIYAVNNGARVLSNSWGSEGTDPKEEGDNRAMQEVIASGQEKGVLFVFAAGNGHAGVGYDNDKDPKPGIPASYPIENIISVAAIDQTDKLGAFSNWGLHTVHIAAPGVKVYSTTVDNTYADTLFDILGLKATWDGTSMAAPHVSGALALYWSLHPTANWRDVKKALLDSAVPIVSMKGKSVTGGKLNVEKLLQH